MNEVTVTLELEEGKTTEVQLDVDFQNLTMRESVRLEELLGEERFDKLISRQMTDAEMSRPSIIRAILYTKLKTMHPTLELEAFDTELTELMEVATQESPKAESEKGSSE